MSTEPTAFKSGFIALAGMPNVGKSTFLNHVLEQKIAITSARPQTTRNRILGIHNTADAQLIFIDTPGVHRSEQAFNQRMVKTALAAMDESNVVLWVVDATKPYGQDEDLILDALKRANTPTVLALNKIDLVNKGDLLQMIEHYRSLFEFAAIVPISALRNEGLRIVIDELIPLLPEGPQYFPADMITDLPERFLVAELVREKVMRLCRAEVPYAVAVTVESFEEKPEKNLVVIHAALLVERQSQKGILVGKQGSMLKQIGQQAREDIERLLGVKVYLSLFVRVSENWRRDESKLRQLGY